MRFLKWAAASAAIATVALLTACGGSGSTTKADMRLINASAGYSTLDMTVNSVSVSTGVAYGAAGSYTSVDTTLTGTQIINASTTVLQTTPTLAGDAKYSLIAYGWPNAMRTALLQEQEPAPAANVAKLLVLNLAPDAGPVNVYLTAGTGNPVAGTAAFATAVQGGSGSGYLQTASGTYHVRVTGSASVDVTTDVRMDFDGLVLDSTTVNTLIITPSQGGVLVNAMSVVQQGAVKAYGGNNARIRVIHSVLGTGGPNAAVVASHGTTSLMNTSFPATIGNYSIVTAGTAGGSTNVSVDGVALPADATPLVAGNDYTVLVYGNAAAPHTTLIIDDNKLPANGYAKFRILNGAADPAQAMTMKLNFTPISDSTPIATASTPYTTIATAGANLIVTAANLPGQSAFSLQNFTMVNQGVYTVYMLGTTGATTNGVTTNLVSELRQDR